jgi:hypothetical protein
LIFIQSRTVDTVLESQRPITFIICIKAHAEHTEIVYKLTIFCVAALLIKSKQQHGKNQNKNNNCMDFAAVHTKINKKQNRNFFKLCLGFDIPINFHINVIILSKTDRQAI